MGGMTPAAPSAPSQQERAPCPFALPVSRFWHDQCYQIQGADGLYVARVYRKESADAIVAAVNAHYAAPAADSDEYRYKPKMAPATSEARASGEDMDDLCSEISGLATVEGTHVLITRTASDRAITLLRYLARLTREAAALAAERDDALEAVDQCEISLKWERATIAALRAKLDESRAEIERLRAEKLADEAQRADAARYRWLLEDHDDYGTREIRRSICENLCVKTYGHVSHSIDLAMAALTAPRDMQRDERGGV